MTKSIYYPPSTHLSHNKIDKCGKILSSKKSSPSDLELANKEIELWRASHLYPLNTFRTTLINKAKRYKNAIVAQRLKRMSTIIRKLIRFPNMKLSTMQDVAGIRVILDSLKEVYELMDYYTSSKISHELIETYDYIKEPKEDGYRGIHLVFKYRGKNEIAREYDGLRIELQLRTRLQHTWATAVETAGLINKEKYKNGIGNKNWLKFFKLTSEAFELIEYIDKGEKYIKQPKRSAKEVYDDIRNLDEKEHILSRLLNFSNAIKILDKHKVSAEYYIISVIPSKHEVRIYPYKKQNYEMAVRKYSELENGSNNSDSDQVLVSVGDIKNLRIAYPNYFADIREFVDDIIIMKNSNA